MKTKRKRTELLVVTPELLEALVHIQDVQKEFGIDSSGRMVLRIEKEDWKLIKKAIKKATL